MLFLIQRLKQRVHRCASIAVGWRVLVLIWTVHNHDYCGRSFCVAKKTNALYRNFV